MKYGFVKVAAASPQLKVADVKFNTLKIEEEIARQAENGHRDTCFSRAQSLRLYLRRLVFTASPD